jgi:predicted HTH domain antitoxin
VIVFLPAGDRAAGGWLRCVRAAGFRGWRGHRNQDTMNITLQIPDSIARSLRIPEAEAEARVRQELAAALYGSGLLSFGKASELAGISRFAFSEVLTQRQIPRHYGEDDLSEDSAYAGGQ